MSQTTQESPVMEAEDLPIESFYHPSESLTIRIADRIESLEAEAIRGMKIKDSSDVPEEASDIADFSVNSATSNTETSIQQRFIAEEIDACLADYSESREATQGRLVIQNLISVGMADALGLDETDELLTELSSDFQNWIDGCGTFTTGWGELTSTMDGCIYLRAFAEVEEQGLEPDLSFTRSFPSDTPSVTAEPAKPARGLFASLVARLGGG
jgi:hypothetical protein